MRNPLALALLGLSAATANPAAGQVQYREWLNQCTPGAIQACFSVALRLEYQASTVWDEGVTSATWWFSSLQGSAPWIPAADPYAIHALHLSGMVTPSERFRANSRDPVGAASDEGVADVRNIHYGVTAWHPGELLGWTHDYIAIWGCDAPTLAPHGYVSGNWTCGGFARVDMQLRGRFAFDEQTTASIRGVTWVEGDDGTSVRHNLECVAGLTCTSVVPEPSTWVLLATGLLVLGVAGRRRFAELSGGDTT